MNNQTSGFSRFLLLWCGELISSIGGGLTSFGLAVYVFNETGSAASMAVVSLLAFLPTLLLTAPAGVLADRFDRRLLMMIGDGCSGLGVCYILVCMLTGHASLTQICIGVTVSSVFSALLEPSYRATVTDLLTKEEFSKASGMVSLAGSARYLISPALAGFLMAASDIKLLLVIDIATFIVTVITTGIVRQGIVSAKSGEHDSFFSSFREGWRTIARNRGILILTAVSGIMTCFMGTFQILAEPMILDFTDSRTLGIAETVCACGMLISGLFLGIKGIRSGYVRILSLSLAFAGIMMALFGVKQSIYLMGGVGFLFFAMLPFANNCMDYLMRTNIPDEKQGRAWGLIGFLSQLGYVAAYGLAGLLADFAAKRMHVTVGRGSACIVILSGALLFALSAVTPLFRSVRALEKGTSQ